MYRPGDLVESIYALNTVQISNRPSEKPLNVIDFPAALPADPPSYFCSTEPALKRCQTDAGLHRALISLSQEIPADDHEPSHNAATSALSTDYRNKLQYVPNPINVPLAR